MKHALNMGSELAERVVEVDLDIKTMHMAAAR